MGDLIEYNSSPPSSNNNRNLPVREDCWSEEATDTLVEAWGRRYVDLNRGNLRQKDWQDVADSVNSLHGHSKKTYRTDVQCKNRIDTVKKKYKVEKARVVMSNGSYVSPWMFYDRLDVLIGSITSTGSGGVAGGGSVGGPSSSSGKKGGQQSYGSPAPLARSPPVGVPLLGYRKAVPVSGVRVGARPVAMAPPAAAAVSLPQKRERERDIRRNYSEVAAAAAAAEDMEEEEDDELDRESEDEEELEKGSEEEGEEGGMRRLAKAIEMFGEVYRRVEGEKLRQMVELEKQRMQFAKDLEVQRLKMFMDTQVQMERLKHAKRSDSDDICS
ncbi:hypothetical protein MLD38_037093 [Melastoma candidum]|uniref:Uncharacterized protein n=1 Tax=Melastoma candidum TaxID=119954 RepID=A0ACB9LMQ8_9MYRT|nr:hypothetical protein MLD38_037093 [Melastoma candidum]